MSKSNVNEYYILKYWIGLLDGSGSLEVSHWRYKFLQYKIQIKLELSAENEIFCAQLKKDLKGYSKRDSKYIYWYEIKTSRIKRVLFPLIQRYPLLNRNRHLEYLFMLHCMSHNRVDIYLLERSYKYHVPVIGRSPEEIYKSFYFPIWLSGYIEARGYFNFREKSTKIFTFSISEKDDFHLIEAIKLYFGFPNNIRLVKGKYFEIEVTSVWYLTRIINQGVEYPFLGEKRVTYDKFKKCVMSSFRPDFF
jgi:hypothetical protein